MSPTESPSPPPARRALGAAALLGAALAAACGQAGTIDVELVTAPGSTVLDDVVRVRLVLSNPLTVVEADRAADGSFELALDVVAEGPSGEVLLEGLDADGEVRAYGRTPPLPIAAIDAAIRVYVAAPMSMAEAPVRLEPARADLGASTLEYGVLLAGGATAQGAAADLEIYNAYDHALQRGMDLPAPRARPTVATGITGYVYLLGGEAADGAPASNLWAFDTTIPPDGAYAVDDLEAAYARAGAPVAPLGSDVFLVGGSPPLVVEGLLLRGTALDDPPALGGGLASVQRQDDPGAPIYTLAIGAGAGASGVVRLAAGVFTDEGAAPPDAARDGHAVVATVDDRVIAIGGGDAGGLLASAVVADPALRTYASRPDVLATPRRDAAVAATARYLVVAGGTDADGAVVDDVEVLDVVTLARVATLPLRVPRTGAVARALPNQQVLIAGGRDADGAPVAELELFTPVPPALPTAQ